MTQQSVSNREGATVFHDTRGDANIVGAVDRRNLGGMRVQDRRGRECDRAGPARDVVSRTMATNGGATATTEGRCDVAAV